MPKDIVKKFTFSKDELEKMQDIHAGITVSNAQLSGLQIYKDVLLESVFKRLGINGDPTKGYGKTIQYYLSKNEIVYTQSPLPNKDMVVGGKK